MKKIFLITMCIILSCCEIVLANAYEMSQVMNVKTVTEYTSNSSLDMVDTVIFGSYPQSDETGIQREPIEWLVLEKQDNKVLLFSKYILAGKVFDDNPNNECSYTKSRIRNWLNDSFYQMAFNGNEQTKIITTAVDGIDNDKIFLLSGPECDKYFGFANTNDSFGTNNFIITKGTKYASGGTDDNYLKNDSDENDSFWLRTPGEFGICVVSSEGWFNWTMSESPECFGIGVRPAMWVNILQ